MKTIKLFLSIAIATLVFASNLQAQSNKERKDIILSSADLEKIATAVPNKLPAKESKRKILVFSKTSAARHIDGIPATNAMFKILGERFKNFDFTFTEDVSYFESYDKLKEFDCIVLNNTTGNFFAEHFSVMKTMPKDEKEKIQARDLLCQKNFMEYVKNGGGVFAIHAAVDSYKSNKDMRKLMGGMFAGHPWTKARIIVEDSENPILKGIWPEKYFEIKTEIYQVTNGYDRNACRVLMRLDFENSPITSEKAKSMVKRTDEDFAVAWLSSYGKGRYVYSTFGHGKEAFVIPQINEFNLRALLYACGDLSVNEEVSGSNSAPKISKAFKKFLEERE